MSAGGRSRIKNAQACCGTHTPRQERSKMCELPLSKGLGRRQRRLMDEQKSAEASKPRAGGEGPNMRSLLVQSFRDTCRSSPREAVPGRVREASGGTTHGSGRRVKCVRQATSTPGAGR